MALTIQASGIERRIELHVKRFGVNAEMYLSQLVAAHLLADESLESMPDPTRPAADTRPFYKTGTNAVCCFLRVE